MRRLTAVLAPLAAVAVASASALQPAGAATGSTVVTADVTSATELTATGCTTGSAAARIGTVLPGTVGTTGADCTLVFGSSNDSSQLRLSQLDGGLRAMYGESTGTLDTSFNTTGTRDLNVSPWPSYFDLEPYPDGGWIVAGEADAGSGWEFQVERLTAAGATSWSVNRVIPSSNDSMAFDVDVDAAGRIVLVGHSSPATYDAVVMRLLPTGALDTAFNPSGTPGWVALAEGTDDQQFNAVGHQSSGKILAGGFDLADGIAKLYRFNADGSIDTSFGTSGYAAISDGSASEPTINDIEVLADDSIIVAGNMYHDFLYDAFIVKLTPGGVVDASWGGGLQWIDTDDSIADPLELFLHLDHDPVNGVAWLTSSYDGGANEDTLVARFDTNGDPDTNFAPGGVLTYGAVAGVDDHGTGVVAALDGSAYVVSERVSNGQVYMRHITSTGTQDMRFAGDGDWDSGSGWTDTQYRARIEMGRDGKITGIARTMAWQLDALTIPDFASGSDDFTSATGAFGACMRTLTGGSTDVTTWTVDGGNDCATGAGDEWNPIVADSTTAGSKVALRATPGTATVTLRFGLRAPDGAAPGNYFAPVAFDVLAPDAP